VTDAQGAMAQYGLGSGLRHGPKEKPTDDVFRAAAALDRARRAAIAACCHGWEDSPSERDCVFNVSIRRSFTAARPLVAMDWCTLFEVPAADPQALKQMSVVCELRGHERLDAFFRLPDAVDREEHGATLPRGMARR
jgi:hypothetical protein